MGIFAAEADAVDEGDGDEGAIGGWGEEAFFAVVFAFETAADVALFHDFLLAGLEVDVDDSAGGGEGLVGDAQGGGVEFVVVEGLDEVVGFVEIDFFGGEASPALRAAAKWGRGEVV